MHAVGMSVMEADRYDREATKRMSFVTAPFKLWKGSLFASSLID